MSEETPSPRRRLNVSLRFKILIGFTVVFTVIFAAAFYWFYTYSTQMALSRIREDLLDTLHGAIQRVDGDEFAIVVRKAQGAPESGLPPGDSIYLDPLYLRHQALLNDVHLVEPRAIPYTYVAGPRFNTLRWVGDIFRITNPDEMTYVMQVYTRTTESVILNGLITNTVNMNPYPDAWGQWVSAYGPIKDSHDRIVGALGIDFRADYVLQVQEGIRNSMVLAFAITYGSLFALVFIISQVLTRPIIRLTKIAERIGEGDYDQDVLPKHLDRFPDEIDTLARVFAAMVDKVRQREMTLRRQVEELRIEIDEVKRQRQVTEIVDTDFFQSLQERARRIRERSRRLESGSDPEAKPSGE